MFFDHPDTHFFNGAVVHVVAVAVANSVVIKVKQQSLFEGVLMTSSHCPFLLARFETTGMIVKYTDSSPIYMKVLLKSEGFPLSITFCNVAGNTSISKYIMREEFAYLRNEKSFQHVDHLKVIRNGRP